MSESLETLAAKQGILEALYFYCHAVDRIESSRRGTLDTPRAALMAPQGWTRPKVTAARMTINRWVRAGGGEERQQPEHSAGLVICYRAPIAAL
jgi:hypothetical protein